MSVGFRASALSEVVASAEFGDNVVVWEAWMCMMVFVWHDRKGKERDTYISAICFR